MAFQFDSSGSPSKFDLSKLPDVPPGPLSGPINSAMAFLRDKTNKNKGAPQQPPAMGQQNGFYQRQDPSARAALLQAMMQRSRGGGAPLPAPAPTPPVPTGV